jgi:tRNA(fMet)-specific endonuclease VapC
MICLDTNAVIPVLNETESRVGARLRATLKNRRRPVAISSVVLLELWHGAIKSARPERNAKRIEEFLTAPIQVLPFDADDACEAGDIRAALERTGKPIGPYDLLIAAQARRRGATLITANEREFARVPGLKTADWAAA